MNELNDIITSYNDYVKKIAPGSLKIAQDLREENLQQALQSILQFSEGMGWIVEVNQLLKQQGVNVTLKIEQVHEFLNEINSGLEMQDYVLVADMFEYEIAPYFEQVVQIEGIEQ